MVERHYEEEDLIDLMDARRSRHDPHLSSCEDCSEKVQSFSAVGNALRDPMVWGGKGSVSEPVPSTIATLRAFASRLTDEDTRAETILTDLLEGPREGWAAKLARHPEYRTAGMVRKLNAAASRAVDTVPPDAVEMTALSTDIADHLDPATYPSDTVSRLRGQAWRERGFALYYTGRYPEAMLAVERSDADLSRCTIDEYDRARTGIVKTLLLRSFERLGEAERVVRGSAATFLDYQDLARSASATMARAQLLFIRGEFESAMSALEAMELRLRDSEQVETHGRILGVLGYGARRMGQVDRSIQYYELSTAMFDSLGISTEVTKNRWNIGLILSEAGNLPAAERCLQEVVVEMEAAAMTIDATLARLDLVEIFLGQGRFSEVEDVCRVAMRSFERAGITSTQRALTALAFIREAAIHGKANRTLVRGVRDYLERLPSEPNLLFAMPPA